MQCFEKGGKYGFKSDSDDYFFEEPLGMNALNKRGSYEFKNDPWFQRDFTDEHEDIWKHRVLFPPEKPEGSLTSH